MIPTRLTATGSVVLTDDVRDFIDEKVKKLEKVLDVSDTALHADVEVGTTGGARTGEQYRAEINVKYSGGFARAEATRESLQTAIDEAVEEVRTELHKMRTKRRDLVRRGAARVKGLFRYFSK